MNWQIILGIFIGTMLGHIAWDLITWGARKKKKDQDPPRWRMR